MSHAENKNPSRDPNDFVEKFEAILLTLFEEYKKKHNPTVNLTLEQKNIARSLQAFVISGGLNFSGAASETTTLCDAFISDWDSAGIRSAAVQQLIALLNRPHVRGAMISAEDISANRYIPKLPAVPFEVDEDEGIAVKVVRIVKRDETLGATIRSDRGKIYIARLIAGGVAARSACIQEGDRILEVNGIPISDLSVDDVARILNRVDCGTVTLKLVPSDLLSASSSAVSHIYLRAQHDYNGRDDIRHPCPEVALSFSKGDILELLVCNDDHWWQARRIGSGAFAHCEDNRTFSRIGLIPSEALQLQKNTSEIEQKSDGRGSSRSGSSHEVDLVYEPVCRMSFQDGFSRIIVLVGSPGVGRNELKRRLITRFPQRFSTTVPHTSRAKRVGEVEGVDYHFVERAIMEKMIYSGQMLEFGEYRGNLYGTALHSVRAAQKEGTPLITPHPLALQVLRTPEFMPFIVFIKPPDVATFKVSLENVRLTEFVVSGEGATVIGGPNQCTNTRAVRPVLPRTSTTASKKCDATRSFTDTEIERIIEGSALLYKQYGHLFDAVIVNDDLEDSFTQLIRLINDLETKPTWVPLSWATNIRLD